MKRTKHCGLFPKFLIGEREYGHIAKVLIRCPNCKLGFYGEIDNDREGISYAKKVLISAWEKWAIKYPAQKRTVLIKLKWGYEELE